MSLVETNRIAQLTSIYWFKKENLNLHDFQFQFHMRIGHSMVSFKNEGHIIISRNIIHQYP